MEAFSIVSLCVRKTHKKIIKTHKNQDNRFAQFNWMMIVFFSPEKMVRYSPASLTHIVWWVGLRNQEQQCFRGRKKNTHLFASLKTRCTKKKSHEIGNGYFFAFDIDAQNVPQKKTIMHTKSNFRLSSRAHCDTTILYVSSYILFLFFISFSPSFAIKWR